MNSRENHFYSEDTLGKIIFFMYVCGNKICTMTRRFALIMLIVMSFICLFGQTGETEGYLPAQENPFMRMAGKKYADYSYDLAMYMHYTVFASRDTVHIKRMIDQLREVAEKTGSKAWTWEVRLAELGLLDIKNVMEGNENRSVEELQIAYDLLGKAEKDNMPQIALRLRFLIVESYWDVIRNYELAFEQCVILDKFLNDISTDDFPEKADYLAKIADIHYHFRDYPKAMFYFARILEENENINIWHGIANGNLGQYCSGWNKRRRRCKFPVINFFLNPAIVFLIIIAGF